FPGEAADFAGRIGSLQDSFRLAMFWFMAVASVLAILTHWCAMSRA
ncbi:MAG: hypothetical protein HY245_04655, partial [Rhizobiales bacterium]|nr:hypothetical protein [Hyphomicrobiales bacterium]